MIDVPQTAPTTGGVIVQVLLLLGLFFGVGTALALIAWGTVTRRGGLVNTVSGFAAVGVAAYLLVMLAASAVSSDQVLLPPTEKYICELDCHLAYSVAEAHSAPALGTSAALRSSKGRLWVIWIRTRFDSLTIASWRPRDVPLTPNPRRVALVDRSGTYAPLDLSPARLAELGLDSTPMSQSLTPGESYLTAFVFDVPSDVTTPRVLVSEDLTVNRMMIGHELSPFHGRTLLGLPASVAAAR